jgi:hypothetical protein
VVVDDGGSDVAADVVVDSGTDVADAADAAPPPSGTVRSTLSSSTLELTGVSFGVSAPVTVGGTGSSGGKMTLSDVNITTRSGPLAASLTAKVFSGAPISSILLTLPATSKAGLTKITLTNVFVSGAADSAGPELTHAFSFAPSKITIDIGTTLSATLDIVAGTSVCTGAPCCADTAILGRFVQALEGWPLPPSSVRVDAVATAVSIIPPTSGGGAGKPQLQAMQIATGDSTAALCTLAKMKGTPLPAMEVDVESSLSATFSTPKLATAWQLCRPSFVDSVALSWSGDGTFANQFSLVPSGYVRTDRSFSTADGSVTDTSTVGYSRLTNASIMTCAP